MKRPRRILAWLLPALGLLLLGIVLLKGISGFSFSAYLCFGGCGVIACYFVLDRLKQNCPKLRRVLWWMVTGSLCLGFICAGITGAFIACAAGKPPQQCDYVIVLGAGVNGKHPSYILQSRIQAAYDYLCANPDTICILSGGQGNFEDISEAQCMYENLVDKGIDPARLWLEDASTDTRENMAFSRKVMEENLEEMPDTVGIITSEFHQFRAGLYAREQGWESVSIRAPTGWFALRLNYFLREIPAVWAYLILGG